MTRDNYENYNEEWKSCRETVAKFDNTLIDLRKYGFTIITSLLTAGSFLGFNAPTASLQVGVIIVTMTLIVILYWMDIYYQNLLVGSILRTNFLEIFRLNRGLSFYISKLYGRPAMGAALHILYAGFLIAAFILGMFAANLSGTTSEISANVNNEKVKLMDSNSSEILGHPLSYQCKFPLNVCDELSILYVSLGLGFLAMLIIFLLFDQVRSNNGEIINRIIVLRKRELDDLKGDPINQSQRDEKALQAEREIYRVLTNRIGPYRLWKLSRMSDQKFLRKIESLI